MLYDRWDISTDYYHRWTDEAVGTWDLSGSGIVLGPQGVAALIDLTPEQLSFYEMSPSAAPHVTLAVSPAHSAKDLGPMCKQASDASDWVNTQLPQVLFSPSTSLYKICSLTQDKATPETLLLDRQHGREKTDHPHKDFLCSTLPSSLWAEGPGDVGTPMKVSPVTFDYESPKPVFRAQYPISDLKAKQVIYPTSSPWNTPILPVPKPGTDIFRMAHDLRLINQITKTKPPAVPNPYTCLNSITSQFQFFSVIDLKNAFFHIPLHPSVQPLFAFTFEGQQYTYRVLPQGWVLSPGIFNQCLRTFLEDLDIPLDAQSPISPLRAPVQMLLRPSLKENHMTVCPELILFHLFALACMPHLFLILISHSSQMVVVVQDAVVDKKYSLPLPYSAQFPLLDVQPLLDFDDPLDGELSEEDTEV
ncbi:uncharacterized protein LOC121653990 [Melanotaenia boesemani]|uniref:uncharacterized protein LOC121653990 n=1 Tax=Melanotaenia boesemani TaxID=1250792 RepID=UPI001C03A90E|nr:uncharacterized protein LOC121653990 [Melanotaenia boesemani]